jgi:hypothetical protein
VSRGLVAGIVLAVACLAYVLYPLLRPRSARIRDPASGASPGRAVTDDEIEAAIRAYRERHPAGSPACPVCGPRPESDAAYCSMCGRSLDGATAP